MHIRKTVNIEQAEEAIFIAKIWDALAMRYIVNIYMIGFGVVGSGYGQFEFNFIECIFSITYYMYLKTAVVSAYDNKFVYFCYRYWMSLKTSLCSTADTTCTVECFITTYIL